MSQTSADRRSVFASKTTFDFLEVESAEESEGEEIGQSQNENEESVKETKPTKSALKKAARAARIEKKIQQRLAAKNKSSATVPPEPQNVLPDVATQTSTTKPLEPSDIDSFSTLTQSKPAEPLEPAVLPQTTDEESLETPGLHINPEGMSDPVPPPDTNLSSFEKSPFIGTRNGAESELKLSADSLKVTHINPEKPSNGSHLLVGQTTNGSFTTRPAAQPEDTKKAAEKKSTDVLTRTLWTFIMIGGFIALLLLGHAYMVLLVVLCQTIVYREVTALFSLKSKDTDPELGTTSKKDPWSKTLNWYFFAATNYFLYGESIIYYFKHVVFADAQLLPFATNHRIISFTLYTIGFMGFVMSLKKGYLKQQFGLFCWVHMSLLLIVVSSHFIVNNILEGLIWFWVPASLVICNDVFAYIWGRSIGKTPLIKLSPKKTVEGFVGAFWSTIIFGLLWGTYFMRFDYMICPVQDLGVSAWSAVSCVPNPVFVWREWQIWKPVAVFLSTMLGRQITALPYAPYHLHLLCMSCFASLVAPFGGFFASGFKRAFNIKDFGHSIPGHGGMTDRMDCQFLMGVFTYVYYSSLIRETHVTVGSIMQSVVGGLTVDEQLELLRDLTRYLRGQGIKIQ